MYPTSFTFAFYIAIALAPLAVHGWSLELFNQGNCQLPIAFSTTGTGEQGCTQFGGNGPISFNWDGDDAKFDIVVCPSFDCTNLPGNACQGFANTGCETLLSGGTPAHSFRVQQLSSAKRSEFNITTEVSEGAYRPA